MPLENGDYISDLVSSNPTGSDNKSTGDDHLRLLKKTIKASFPAVAGPVTKTHTELNAAHDARVPVGGIIMWSGAVVDIPSGWLLCNGASGTPNLQDRFVIGAGSLYAVGATGGSKDAVVAAHNHTATLTGFTGAAGGHSHTIQDAGHAHTLAPPGSFNSGGDQPSGSGSSGNISTGSATTGISINGAPDHEHTVNVSGSTASAGVSATNANLPPYYALCFIQKSA